jgi:hypothetical protein
MEMDEAEGISTLLEQAKNFSSQLQNRSYKRSLELNLFQKRVCVLTERQLQHRAQFHKHGLSDQTFLHAVHAAIECLHNEQQYAEKVKNNGCFRWKRRAFPSSLLDALDKVLELIHADPQLQTLRAATWRGMGKRTVSTPTPLPFQSDQKYVPNTSSIESVQHALESVEGPQVVTLYGEPGLGKSSLAKYLALHYENQNKHRMKSSPVTKDVFADGVHYLVCGQGAKDRIKQLQQELLKNLGVETGSNSRLQGCDECCVPSNQAKLRSHLAEQKLLILLDDVWEAEILMELFVYAKGVKYLITSQIKDIWVAAEKIKLSKPTNRQARRILANYTEGLPNPGVFPEDVLVSYIDLLVS